jgi:hypothetical protein
LPFDFLFLPLTLFSLQSATGTILAAITTLIN